MQRSGGKNRWLWLAVLFLFVFVAASAFILMGRLSSYLLDDSGAIALIPVQEFSAPDALAPNSIPLQQAEQSSPVTKEPAAESPANTPAAPPAAPGFETSDDSKVWSTDTQVDIFRVSYENGEGTITVHSNDGDRLIAPGTENTYAFKLKNTGNVSLDYSVEVDAFVTPDGTPLPVTGRLSRYDGKWLAGAPDTFADISALDAAADTGTLSAGRYTYYTLDWLWPFENGNDALDTMLGNAAVDGDLLFTIVIRTVATASLDPEAPGGIIPPVDTGDDFSAALWLALAICSLFLMMVLLVFHIREKRRA